MHCRSIFLRDPADQEPNAGVEWKAFPFCLLEVLRKLGEGGGLKLEICAGRQIKDRDRYLAVCVFKSGKMRARLEIARHFEADTGARRKCRILNVPWWHRPSGRPRPRTGTTNNRRTMDYGSAFPT